MKYLALIIGLLLIVPLRNALQRRGFVVSAFWFLTGVFCFLMQGYPELSVGVVSWGGYPGHTSGIEVTVVDLAMAAYFFSLPKSTSRLPFSRTMAFYFICVLISGAHTSNFEASLFYAWQLLRMFFVYIVVSRACVDSRAALTLLKGLAFGLLIQAGVVAYQKFLGHTMQPAGTFIHQNYLGIVSNLTFIPLLALNLTNKVPLLFRSSLLSGGIIAVLTASRATLGLAGLGAVLVFCHSFFSGQAARGMKSILIVSVVAISLVPLAVSSMKMRVSQFDPYSDYDERVAFEKAAAMMIQDHPWGVGANNFVIEANTGGYYDRAGVAVTPGSRGAHVHNLYYLTTAELGYLGLLGLIMMLLQPAILAFRCSWQHRGTEDSAFLGGLGITLLIAYAHSNYEWIAVSQHVQYFLAIIFGLVAATSKRLSTSTAE